LPSDERSSIVIEVALEQGTAPDVQAGAARLVEVMAEIAADFHRRLELTMLRRRDFDRAQFAGLVTRLHTSLDPVATAYRIANDGRQWIGCDRVSVLRLRHKRAITLAVSAVDQVDRRSAQVVLLERLAAAVAAVGEPLVWREEDDQELPTELAGSLQSYLNQGHARQLVAIPLCQPAPESQPHDGRPPHGLLIAESFTAAQPPELLLERASELARLSAPVLGNALAYHALPLLPLQTRLARWLSAIWRRPVLSALVVATAAALFAILALVPADFSVEVEGSLEPQRRRELFAPSDGVVEEVLASHGDRVARGDVLLRIRSPALDLDASRIGGELQTAQARLEAVRSSRSRPDDAAAAGEADRLASEELQLQEQVRGLENQLQVLQQLRRELAVASPHEGVVLTWNTHQLLGNRPVKQGQSLLTVADADGPWALELQIPDRPAGHVLAGQHAGEEKLPVTFILASDPAFTHHGHLDRLAVATDVSGGKSKTEAIVALVGPLPADARAGTHVTARIHCGRRSIGYVWLHDVIDFVRTNLLF
jgi:multidrug efflux pump subunit AcrA (membrane-fusion protein)